MAFLLGSLTSGMFGAANDVMGMYDTYQNAQARRAGTESLKQETKMKQSAFDAGKNLIATPQAPGSQTMEEAPSQQQSGSSEDERAVTEQDLSTLPTPSHLRAINYQPGVQGASTTPRAATPQMPYSPAAQGASTTPQAIPTLPTSAPHYLPGQPTNYPSAHPTPGPANASPNWPTGTPVSQPPAPASAPPASPIGTPGFGVPSQSPGFGTPRQTSQMAMPSLASNESGLGATILAAMNPTAGAQA